jgi:archaellum component FlaC
MSVGDWFTLRPFKFDYVTEEELNNRLAPIENSLTELRQLLEIVDQSSRNRDDTLGRRISELRDQTNSRLDNLENSLTNMNIRLGNVENEINNSIKPQLNNLENIVADHGVQIANLDAQINNFNSQINDILFRLGGVEAQVNGIINLFHPEHTNFTIVRFTNGISTTDPVPINFNWYRLYKPYSGNAMDVKYYWVVVRGFSVNLGWNGSRFWMVNPIDYPFGVSANYWRSATVSPGLFEDKQAKYDFEFKWDPPKYTVRDKIFCSLQ